MNKEALPANMSFKIPGFEVIAEPDKTNPSGSEFEIFIMSDKDPEKKYKYLYNKKSLLRGSEVSAAFNALKGLLSGKGAEKFVQSLDWIHSNASKKQIHKNCNCAICKILETKKEAQHVPTLDKFRDFIIKELKEEFGVDVSTEIRDKVTKFVRNSIIPFIDDLV
jgi:hypothetical protein